MISLYGKIRKKINILGNRRQHWKQNYGFLFIYFSNNLPDNDQDDEAKIFVFVFYL